MKWFFSSFSALRSFEFTLLKKKKKHHFNIFLFLTGTKAFPSATFSKPTQSWINRGWSDHHQLLRAPWAAASSDLECIISKCIIFWKLCRVQHELFYTILKLFVHCVIAQKFIIKCWDFSFTFGIFSSLLIFKHIESCV